MTSLFMDTSALVKRYVREIGSRQVERIVAENQSEIRISEITLEVAAAFAAKARVPHGITREELENALSDFLGDCEKRYQLVPASRATIDLAVKITQRRKIRGCDAIQLATALALNQIFGAGGLEALLFVAADTALLEAAIEEGLAVENPEEH